MAWTDLTFSSGSKLTSTKMTQVQSNFSALAGGELGAPPISVNSLMWSGVASGGYLDVSSAITVHGDITVDDAITVGGAVTVAGAAISPPVANTIYKDNIVSAWISFNGTGTISINDSFNVASITDNGTGNYTVTWDTDFADANYAISATCAKQAGVTAVAAELSESSPTAAGSVGILTIQSDTPTSVDPVAVHVIAIGDQ